MIKDRLFSLPNEIENKKVKILNEREELENDREKLKLWEIDKIESINDAVDDNGKALYSNDTKRKIALENMKLEDNDYLELSEKLQSRTYHVARLEIQLDKLYNEQSNLRAICRLEGGANEY
ncbi:hypothetical protein [Tissierella praeacuta]|uniref:hypothetical protein n=1 Tax=Tissierella praeacuta TaxID=43131 RepID=UPI00333F8767